MYASSMIDHLIFSLFGGLVVYAATRAGQALRAAVALQKALLDLGKGTELIDQRVTRLETARVDTALDLEALMKNTGTRRNTQ